MAEIKPNPLQKTTSEDASSGSPPLRANEHVAAISRNNSSAGCDDGVWCDGEALQSELGS